MQRTGFEVKQSFKTAGLYVGLTPKSHLELLNVLSSD